MMDPEKIMTGLSKEIESTLKALGKAKTPEERRVHSETLRNLCESFGVFLNFLQEVMAYDDEDGAMPF